MGVRDWEEIFKDGQDRQIWFRESVLGEGDISGPSPPKEWMESGRSDSLWDISGPSLPVLGRM